VVSRSDGGSRVTLAMNLELRPGRYGASARIELHERDGCAAALVSVRGWVDRVALDHLDRSLHDLSTRGIPRIVLDCSRLRHIEFRLVSPLVDSLERFESNRGGYAVCGLTPRLRESFRVAGCEPGLHCWPSASEVLASSFVRESEREWAS